MKQTTLTVSGASQVIVTRVGGDLQVVGWERAEVSAKANRDGMSLSLDGEQARATSDDDLVLYIPSAAALQIANVEGDADLRAVTGPIEILNVGGDLQMRNIGPTTAEKIAGDLSVRNCQGDFRVTQVEDDASLHQLHGSLSLSAEGDVYLREVTGNIQVETQEDAALYLQPQAGQHVQVHAQGDILLRVPAEVEASFDLQGGDEEAVRVDLPGLKPETGRSQRFTLGAGEASINLSAQGEVIVTSRDEAWQSATDFDPLGREGPFAPGEFPDISREIQERVSRKVEEATRRAMKASVRAQEQSDRVQQRVEAAMRRAEEKMRSAERRSAHTGFSAGRWSANLRGARPPAPASEAVTDDERLTILKMLQEKKISLQEAETLLTALEGK